jgi:hypothetical protein
VKTFFSPYRIVRAAIVLVCLILTACGSQQAGGTGTTKPGGSAPRNATLTPSLSPAGSATVLTPTPNPAGLPRFDHVVVVIEENKSYSDIVGNDSAAFYINGLAAQGMLFTNSHAETHPSQPNYLDLFSGSDQGVAGDACNPATAYPGPDLGGQLISAGLSFAGYEESMPSAGYTGCFGTAGLYARKHNPWADFSDVSGATTNLPFSSFPTTAAGFSSLPTVSFVVPNLEDDMHDGTIQQGNSWLQQNMGAYAQWAKTHNSLLIVTWDEAEDTNPTNQIPTIFVGQHVHIGTNAIRITHFDVLRTLEDMYGLTPINNAAQGNAITGIWD